MKTNLLLRSAGWCMLAAQIFCNSGCAHQHAKHEHSCNAPVFHALLNEARLSEILSTGNGKSFETAYRVRSNAEIEMLLTHFKYHVRQHASILRENSYCEIFAVKAICGASFKVYFRAQTDQIEIYS